VRCRLSVRTKNEQPRRAARNEELLFSLSSRAPIPSSRSAPIRDLALPLLLSKDGSTLWDEGLRTAFSAFHALLGGRLTEKGSWKKGVPIFMSRFLVSTFSFILQRSLRFPFCVLAQHNDALLLSSPKGMNDRLPVLERPYRHKLSEYGSLQP